MDWQENRIYKLIPDEARPGGVNTPSSSLKVPGMQVRTTTPESTKAEEHSQDTEEAGCGKPGDSLCNHWLPSNWFPMMGSHTRPSSGPRPRPSLTCSRPVANSLLSDLQSRPCASHSSNTRADWRHADWRHIRRAVACGDDGSVHELPGPLVGVVLFWEVSGSSGVNVL